MTSTTISIADQIIAILEYICGKFGIVIDWTADTILPYAQTIIDHFIKWTTYKSIFWISLGLLFIIMGIVTCILSKKCDSYDATGGVIALGVIFILVGLALSATFSMDLIKAVTFPELATFEYVKSLIGTIK